MIRNEDSCSGNLILSNLLLYSLRLHVSLTDFTFAMEQRRAHLENRLSIYHGSSISVKFDGSP